MKKNVLPDFRQRQDDAMAAKEAILAKFRATPGPDDPAVAERRRAREAMVAERAARVAQREAARLAYRVEQAAQAEREAVEAKARVEAERIEREAVILAEQEAARQTARKAEKKQWRKGLEDIKQTLNAV